MDMSDRAKLRDMITGLLSERADAATFEDSESLIESGRLDSLAVVKIATFLESEFGIDFAETDFDPARIDSIDHIAEFITECRR